MKYRLAYSGHSTVTSSVAADTLSFAPNLAREAVSFDAALKEPLRFREAMSALHDVVVSDLRYKKKDKTAYEEYKRNETRRMQSIRSNTLRDAKAQILKERANVPADFETKFNRHVKRYWNLRDQYNEIIRREDPELWRMLTPCDPVITVADDVCFFECFSVDESAYGCLTVEREAGFGRCDNLKLGTTNVDYSWDLYHHFQGMRSYRETRFKVDPAGFTVSTANNPDYREEKIDLPQGWLRGFMQIQAAMGMPGTAVPLSREAVYSVLAYLKRHRTEKSPRALRFELTPREAPVLVLEPWGVRIVSHGTVYQGPPTEPIRIWGRRRLAVLARLLPLTERFTVHLLGTGLPSFWLAHMGEMTFTLGLSGWTTNDWTRGSALDLLMPIVKPSAQALQTVGDLMQRRRAMSLGDLLAGSLLPKGELAGALNHLAYSGQLIHDLGAKVYRYRSIMAQPLGEAQIGPENEELRAGRTIADKRKVDITGRETLTAGTRFIAGKAESTPVEIIVDGEGQIKRGKCLCGHFKTYGIRNGPCRHMIALRMGDENRVTGDVKTSTGWESVIDRMFNL